MTDKIAIFDPEEQQKFLGACSQNDNEYIPIWLMLNTGMHPSDISQARTKLKLERGVLSWKRAKNDNPRRELIPPQIAERLENWLKHGRKLTRVGYFQLVRRVGTRVGHPEYSPMTLRHTFCINELRRMQEQPKPPPEMFMLLAMKMGCTRSVVAQNYLDLTQWERLGGTEDV